MSALLGVVGVFFVFLAYVSRDRSGARVALFGGLAVVSFGVMIAGTPTRPLTGDRCWIDWDARSNSQVCD